MSTNRTSANLASILALLMTPTASHSQQQRLCICALPEIPPCVKACSEPPKQDFKLIAVSKVIVPTTLGAIGYEQVIPAIPDRVAMIEKLLADSKIRATIKGELEGRAAIALEQRKAVVAARQKPTTSIAAIEAAIGAYENDAKRYQEWGAKIGAAEARSRIGSDLKL